MNNSTLSSNQVAYLQRAMRDGEGHIEIGELARGLGKQKGNATRKLERLFPAEHLFKMKSSSSQNIGNGAVREVETYMLDHKTAGALAMSYDGMLGIKVLTILEDALKTIDKVTQAATAGSLEGVLQATTEFSKRHQGLQYRDGASEKEDRSVALKRISKRNPAALIG